MGKCLLCGKTVLGRRRKCNRCKKTKKVTNDTNETFISETFSINNENNTELADQDKDEEKQDEVENELFIEQLLQLDINDSESEENYISEPSEEQETDIVQFFEIDSIHISLNDLNIPKDDGNLTIYCDPKVFHIKKKTFIKIGWIFFLKSGFQCNLLTEYTNDWKSIYKKTILNIEGCYKKYFLQILPLGLEKVVFNEYISVFLASLVNVIGQDVFLYGKGLKCIINTLYIRNLLYCLSNNIYSTGRIDLSKSLYNDVNMKFDINSFKQYVDSHENYTIGKIRSFSQQFGECSSLIATIKHYNKTIGEITCYYHNSIIYRKFFENSKHSIPSLLGKSISDKCKFNYILKSNYVETLKDLANNCLASSLIRRIEFRILNFENIEENINFFELLVLNVDKFCSNLSSDFEVKYNIIYYYIKIYEANNLVNDLILLEEIIRVFFLGLDSEENNHLVNSITLKLLLIDIRNKYKTYLNSNIINYEIHFSNTDSLLLKRIFNSFCKDKQIFSVIQCICAGYHNEGLDIANLIIKKLFFEQLFLDFVNNCKSPSDQLYSFAVIDYDNEFDLKLYLRIHSSFESPNSMKKILNAVKSSMKQGSLPCSSIIGKLHTLRIRNREFNSKYSYNDYSKMFLETFLNLNEKISGFNSSQLIIQIVFTLFSYINKYTWGEIYDIFDEFSDIICEFLFENEIKLFPLYTFSKLHSQNKNGYQWISLHENDNGESEVDSLSLNFNILNFSSEIEYFEPFEIYDNIISTSNNISCYRLPILSQDIIFDKYIIKINPKFSKDTWESSISFNRSIIMNNKEIYINILRLMASNRFLNLSYKCTKLKLIFALRYLMYVSGTIFMKSIGILTKGIRKDEIKKILPFFEELKTRNAILIIDEQKFKAFHDSII